SLAWFCERFLRGQSCASCRAVKHPSRSRSSPVPGNAPASVLRYGAPPQERQQSHDPACPQPPVKRYGLVRPHALPPSGLAHGPLTSLFAPHSIRWGELFASICLLIKTDPALANKLLFQ